MWISNTPKQIGIKNITTDLDPDVVITTVKTIGNVTWQESSLRSGYKNSILDNIME